MTRKQTVVVAVLVLAASGLSAFVGYRLAFRQSLRQAGSSSNSSTGVAGGPGGCVEFRDADSHTGETTCVSGRVLRVFTSGAGNTFLDFCPDYRTCPFTSVIFSSDRKNFGDLGSLAGRQVEIHGPITTYRGRAQIIIREPQQIRVLP